MPRTYRLVIVVPAVLALLNALAILVAGGPCLPSDIGCS